MTRTINPRARLVALVVALAALALSACSSEDANKNAANRNAAAPNANTAPAPVANANTNTTANANATATANPTATANNTPATPGQTHTATVETALGKIKIELLDKDAPKTAENFRKLAASGFYNGLVFHRTIKGFMIQGGDPNGNGSGGRTADGKPLPNEINRSSPLYQGGYARGLVAMANKGGDPTTATSQFFIMHQNYPLPPQYTVFGRVTEGMDVVDKIATAQTQGERPVNPVKMTKVTAQ